MASSSSSTTPSDEQATKTESNNSVNGGNNNIGKTLTWAALFVALMALALKVLPQVALHHKETQAYLNKAQAYLDTASWSTFDWNSFYAQLQTLTLSDDWRHRPGVQLSEKGATAKYPIVIVPGFTTSGLEVWGNEECGRKYFRTRFWGTMVGNETNVCVCLL